MDQKTANTNRTHSVRGDTAGTVCKRSVFISTLNFPSAENDTNLFIESFTLRDACSFEFALRNTLSFKLNFCVQIYCCVLCDSREQERNSEFNLSFWPHPRITSRCIPIRVASSRHHDKIYVQMQKNCI